MSHYDKILTSAPVNKPAAVITSQGGISHGFKNSPEQELEVLCERKGLLQTQCYKLKREIGIDPRGKKKGAERKYPQRILAHPQYKVYMGIRDELATLEEQIIATRANIKKAAPKYPKFEEHFISIIKNKHPDIYESVKAQIYKEREEMP